MPKKTSIHNLDSNLRGMDRETEKTKKKSKTILEVTI